MTNIAFGGDEVEAVVSRVEELGEGIKRLLSKSEGGRLLKDNPWIMNRKVKGEAVDVLQVFLDQGEAEATALAKQREDSLLIDIGEVEK